MGILTYACAAAIWTSTTKDAVAAMSHPSAGDLMATVWGEVALMVIVILIVLPRHWSAGVQTTLVAMMAIVLISAGIGTVQVTGYARSGFLDQVNQAQKKQATIESHLAQAAAGACQQVAVTGAGVMKSPSDFYPLLIMDEKGNVFGKDVIVQRGWMPSSLSQVRVVVCLAAEASSAQTCSYTGGQSYQLTSYSRDVSIVNAGSGQQLASSTLNGSDDTCAESITSNQIVSDESGEHVSADEVADYVIATAKSFGG
jgi:hypothetical protein